jgi:lysophospholipase L1-like esterase
MANSSLDAPKVLILGHSFVRRLNYDMKTRSDSRMACDFGLEGTAVVHLHGVGGRTVPKLRQYDLGVVSHISPEIVILEVGTNDLSHARPEVVGSHLEELVRLLINTFSVRVVVVCHVTPRAATSVCAQTTVDAFAAKSALLNQYTRVVLEPMNQVLCWTHKGFVNPAVSPFLPDGVHFNPIGQYMLYRSYRGAILHALTALRKQ